LSKISTTIKKIKGFFKILLCFRSEQDKILRTE
jgi:hypothetical protein